MKVLLVTIGLLTAVAAFNNVHAQSIADKDSSVKILLNKLPALPSSADALHPLYCPKSIISPAAKYISGLKDEAMSLYLQSNKQSRLLLMITGKYDDGPRPDFSKVNIRRDKKLEEMNENAKALFFNELDTYSRTVNTSIDSAYKAYTGLALAKAQWEIYRKQIPVLVSKTRKIITDLDGYMEQKGFNKLIRTNQVASAYFLHALEVRGLMIDRLIRMAQVIDGCEGAVAAQIEYCRKNPDQCK